MSIKIFPSYWLNAVPDLLSIQPIDIPLEHELREVCYLYVGSWYGQADLWTAESLQ